VARLLVLVTLLSGCSIALQSKPTNGVARAQSGCSTSSVYWIADASLAALSAIGGTVAYVSTSDTENSDLGVTAAGFAALASVVYLASAGNGHRWRSQCANDQATVTASR
jgi:hypothetical protein